MLASWDVNGDDFGWLSFIFPECSRCSCHQYSNSHFVFFSLQSAIGAAAINIQVPILLGQVTNVVSKFTADNVGDFLEEIKKPAMKLMGVYALQVGIITCQYTSSIHTNYNMSVIPAWCL